MQLLKGPFRESIAPAIAGSLLLHLLIAAVIWQLPAIPAATPYPEHYVPIELQAWPEPLQENPPVEPRPESTAAEPEPASPAVLPEQTESDTDADNEAANGSDARAVQELTEEIEAPDDVAIPPIENERLIPEDVDLEAVRRDAVAHVVESLRIESERRSFSTIDPASSSGTGSTDANSREPDIFEQAANLPRDGLLTPGRGGSRLARRIADFCNSLTGGFSLFGLANVCADPAPRADLFGHLRPQYMESVPLCTADEDLDLEIQQTGATAIGTLKCVLVPRDVRAQYYGRFDPALAGWLPADESDTQADSAATGSAEISD